MRSHQHQFCNSTSDGVFTVTWNRAIRALQQYALRWRNPDDLFTYSVLTRLDNFYRTSRPIQPEPILPDSGKPCLKNILQTQQPPPKV